jgi:hypothetical protein
VTGSCECVRVEGEGLFTKITIINFSDVCIVSKLFTPKKVAEYTHSVVLLNSVCATCS